MQISLIAYMIFTVVMMDLKYVRQSNLLMNYFQSDISDIVFIIHYGTFRSCFKY